MRYHIFILLSCDPMLPIFRYRSGLLLWACLVLLGSCHHVDPDPCSSQTHQTADFTIQEEVGVALLNKTRRYAVDTIAASRAIPIVLSALDTVNTTYEWTVGGDPRVYTSRRISLAFGQAYGSVTVSLRVQKTALPGCPLPDNGVATKQKTLVVLPETNAPIYGDYEGYNRSNPAHRFAIHIRPNSLLNLPEGCRYDLRNEVVIGSTALLAYSGVFDPLYGAAALNGWGALDRQDHRTITFEYTYSDPTKPTPGPPIKDVFVGKRQ